MDHPKRSPAPKSYSSSTLGSSFLTSFLGYYFLAAVVAAGFEVDDDPPTDPTLADPALINYKNNIFFLHLRFFFLLMNQ